MNTTKSNRRLCDDDDVSRATDERERQRKRERKREGSLGDVWPVRHINDKMIMMTLTDYRRRHNIGMAREEGRETDLADRSAVCRTCKTS